MWNTSSNFVRPNLSIETAHTKGTETGSVLFSVDGRTVLTRGGDDTVKREDIFFINALQCSHELCHSMGLARVQEAIGDTIIIAYSLHHHQRHLQPG